MKGKKYIRNFKDHIELIVPHHGYGYQIEKHRMNTSSKVEFWVKHLAEKNWITNGHIYAFLAVATRLGISDHEN